MGMVKGRAATLVVALVALATFGVASPAGAGAEPSSTISGTVVDTGDQPVAGALVLAYRPTDGLGPSALAMTAGDGTYTITGLMAGEVRVAVVPSASPGLALTWYGPATSRSAATPIAVPPGTAIPGIDVELPVSATIDGTVTDGSSAPVAGATVRAYRAGDSWLGSSVTTTETDGSYHLDGLTGDTFRVRVDAPAASGLVTTWYGSPAPATIDVADGEHATGIDVALGAEATIAGTVTAFGAPVAGATVRAFRPNQTWVAAATGTTDATGAFALAGLSAGDLQLLVVPPAASGFAARWYGPSSTRAGSPLVTLAAGEHRTGADVALPLDFPYQGTIDLDAPNADRCDVIATDCLLPFPNDRFTVADPTTPTGRRVHLDEGSMPSNSGGTHIDPTHWNELDGFSPGAAPMLRVADVDLTASGAASLVDPSTSLADGSPVVLLDATTGTRIAHWVELDSYAEAGSVPTLAIHPAVALPEGHRIVVGVRGLVTTGGDPVTPTDGFRAFRDRLRTDVPEVELRRAAMEQVFDDLDGAGVARDSLIVAWDFTVASGDALSNRLLHIRDDAFASLGGAAPAFTVTSNTASTREGIAREVIGTYQVPLYLSGTGAPGSEFLFGPDGLPVRNGTYTARFRCIVPTSATAATPAATGLYGHGLLGTYDQIGASRAVAVQGNRVFCGTDLIGMAEEDVANAVGIIQDLSTFNTLADRLQQGHLNTLFLGRLLVAPDGFAADPAFQDGGSPLIQGAGHLVYYGISQGGIMGAATTAVAQDWTRAMLDVPGSNYSLLLDRSVDFDPFRSVMTPAYPAAADRAMALQLIQMLWDRGEANGYLQHLTADPYEGTPVHTVLLHEAFGDHQVSNVSTAVEARTIGASAHRPALAAGRSAELDVLWDVPDIASYPHTGSAVVMWDSGADPPPLINQPPRTGDDPHDNPRRTPAAITQITTFLATGTVVDTCGGTACAAVP